MFGAREKRNYCDSKPMIKESRFLIVYINDNGLGGGSVEPLKALETFNKMNILGIYWAFIYFAYLQNSVQSTIWIDDLTKYLCDDGNFYQVKLLTRLADDQVPEHPLFDELVVKLSTNLPTSRINFGEDFDVSIHRAPVDTSATLFFVVFEARDELQAGTVSNFVNAVTKMTKQPSPKCIIVLFVRKSSNNFEELLRNAWTEEIKLNLTIIEVAEPEVAVFPIAVNRPEYSPIVHRFNPFKKEYIREKLSTNMKNLFPKKPTRDDFSGRVLRTEVIAKDPLIHLELFNEVYTYEDDVVDGLLQIFAQEFGATVEYIPKEEGAVDLALNDWHTVGTLENYMESKNSDILRRPVKWRFNHEQSKSTTVPIKYDQICALVPIFAYSEIHVNTNIILACSLSLGVVSIFWIAVRVLKLKLYSWSVFNIGRVLFGVSVSQQPRSNVDRIIFTCLLALFPIYSSIIYELITSVIIQKNRQVFETLEDLKTSEILLNFRIKDMQNAIEYFETTERMGIYRDPYECAEEAIKTQGVACFVRDSIAKLIISVSSHNGVASLKMLKPCLTSSVSHSLLVNKRSPFRSRVDKLIGRLHEAGIIEKFYEDAILRLRNTRPDVAHSPQSSDLGSTGDLFHQLTILAITGYSISIVVFIGELIVHRLLAYKKSRTRPLSPPSSNRK